MHDSLILQRIEGASRIRQSTCWREEIQPTLQDAQLPPVRLQAMRDTPSLHYVRTLAQRPVTCAWDVTKHTVESRPCCRRALRCCAPDLGGIATGDDERRARLTARPAQCTLLPLPLHVIREQYASCSEQTCRPGESSLLRSVRVTHTNGGGSECAGHHRVEQLQRLAARGRAHVQHAMVRLRCERQCREHRCCLLQRQFPTALRLQQQLRHSRLERLRRASRRLVGRRRRAGRAGMVAGGHDACRGHPRHSPKRGAMHPRNLMHSKGLRVDREVGAHAHRHWRRARSLKLGPSKIWELRRVVASEGARRAQCSLTAIPVRILV